MLGSLVTKDTLSISPRPVFYEELNLLGMKELGWDYPECQEPLLWACNKEYFYFGEKVFEAKGANIYDKATVDFVPGKETLTLKPVNVKAMLEKTKEQMFLIESEAIEFIHETYLQYTRARKTVEKTKANQLDFEALAARQEQKTKTKMAIVKEDCDSFDIMPLSEAEKQGKQIFQTTKIDKFLASFSGGKDSQVVLDLCTRAIPSTEFEVIYSDTGYELPPSLDLYERVKEHYRELYPDLKFSTARNHEEVINYWDKIGTPSDNHRWCCAVMKTAPLYRLLKLEDNKQARVLTFDGIRAEESTRRSTYARIGKGVKHDTVINASPILNWNAIEIFLYLWRYELPVNPAYRQGMTRVGCLICPFSSEWNDMVSSRCYSDKLQPFLTRVEAITKKSGVKDVDEYIKEGNWKRRSGGRGMSFPASINFVSTKPNLVAKINNPQVDVMTYLRPIGLFNYSTAEDGRISGEIKYRKTSTLYSFSIEKKDKDIIVTFYDTQKDPVLQGLLKRVLNKATYCVQCEVCEVECPTGALHVLGEKPYIDDKRCISCGKCLTFHDFGCIAAASLAVTGKQNQHKMKLISYNNFGLNEGWLDIYFSDHENFFTENLAGLNEKEILPNFAKWLYHAGIIADVQSKEITPLGLLLEDLYMDNPEAVWQIIWVNLSYSSPIAQWFSNSVEWGTTVTSDSLKEMAINDYSDTSATTVKNVTYALIRTFKESPIGKMGQYATTEKKDLFVRKNFEDIDKITVAYSIYKFAEEKGIRSMRVADLYSPDVTGGVYREFGIPKNILERHLRSLNSDSTRLLVAELNMGLDNITLQEGVTSLSCLEKLV